MFYFYKKNLDTPGFEEEVHVMLLCKDSAGVLGETNASYTTTDFIQNLELLKQYSTVAGMYVAVLPGENTPIITLAQNATQCVDATKIVELLFSQFNAAGTTSLGQETMLKIKNVLVGKIGEEHATNIIAAAVLQWNWLHSGEVSNSISVELESIDPAFRAHTRKVLDEINANFTNPLKSIDPLENVTVFQNVCTDPLFIEIPSRMKLLDDSISLSSMLPERKEVCEPYTDPAAYTPDYKTSGVPSYLYPMIEGNRENNGLPVQENEEKYYTALMDWVSYNVKEEFGRADGKIIDALSQAYLRELLSILYVWHWGHNPCVPSEVLPDEDDVDNLSISSKYVFKNVPGQSMPKNNAVLSMLNFVNQASLALGYEVYPRAVIQLARWGDRKPTCLQFEGFDVVFNLGTGDAQKLLGSLEDYQPKLVNGCESTAIAWITEDTAISDTSVGFKTWPMPVGVMTVSVLSNGDDDIELLSYYSIIDFIKELQNGVKFDGVSLENGVFTVPTELASITVSTVLQQYEMKKDSLLKFPFYRSQALQDLFIKLRNNNYNGRDTQLSIMHSRIVTPDLQGSIEKNKFSSQEDLMRKMESGQILSLNTAISLNIAGVLLPIYKEVAKNFVQGCSNSEVFSAWLSAMNKYNYTDEASFFNSKSNATVSSMEAFGKTSEDSGEVTDTSSSSSSSSDNMKNENIVQEQATSVSNDVSNNASNNVQNNVTKNSFVRVVPDDAKYLRILSFDGSLFGYCAWEDCVFESGAGKKKYIKYTVVSEHCNVPEQSISGDIKVSKLMAYLVHTLMQLEVGSLKTQQLFFKDLDTMREYRDKINKL